MNECKACISNLKGIMDYKCLGCCVRHLGELPKKDAVAAMYRSMVRFNSNVEGFADALNEKWLEHVKKRRGNK